MMFVIRNLSSLSVCVDDAGFVRPELRKTTIDRKKLVRSPPLNSEINSDAPPLYGD